MTGSNVLYLTYDGLTDPLGRSQVLPYLIGLAELGHSITILSFEKPDRFDSGRAMIEKICRDAGLEWHPLPYHKAPPIISSVWDIFQMTRVANRLNRNKRFDLVHCRSYMPALCGLHLKRRHGLKFLFDMRAFWADERIDGGQWNMAHFAYRTVFRYFKRKESQFFQEANHIVSLTAAGREIMLARPDMQDRPPPISIIPCCVDFEHFKPAPSGAKANARAQLGISQGARTMVYLGSVGSWYLLDEMFDFFAILTEKEPDAVFLLVTPNTPSEIHAAAVSKGIDPNRVIVREASRDEVPFFASAGDFGLFFIKPVFSKKASSPTKMGELLALGLPVVANGGVGDVAWLIDEMKAGVVVSDFSAAAYRKAISQLDTFRADPATLRQQARARLDLSSAVESYNAIYRDLSGAEAPGSETSGKQPI